MSRSSSPGTGPESRGARARRGRDPLKVGALALVVIGLLVYFGFTKHIPFTHGFRFRAVFSSAVDLKPGSPVRIAGVNVGKVDSISHLGQTDVSVVNLEINNNGLPLHTDSTLKIRPKLFLEGNFFVDLKPGSPSAPVLSAGATIPITQTADPVQLDQILTSLQSDTRSDLQSLLAGYGQALSVPPTAAQDRTQDPSVRGFTGAEALNQVARFSGDAFQSTALVNQALLGTEPHDLSKLIAGLGSVTSALDSNEGALEGLVSNLDTTLAAFASQSSNLQQTIALLPGTLQAADNAFVDLNAAFPPTRTFAEELIPGVKETPATIDAAFPWIAQARGLLSARELGGLTQQLRATVPSLGSVTDQTIKTLPQADLLAKCVTNVILPAGNTKLSDGALSTGKENYKEFWYSMVGLSGESQNFDGNGTYVRFGLGGGVQTISTGPSALEGQSLFGNVGAGPLGDSPAYPGVRPPYKPTVPCYTQPLPDFNGPASRGSAPRVVGPASAP
jgi:ABC-type transporter Mla subunit MlaD